MSDITVGRAVRLGDAEFTPTRGWLTRQFRGVAIDAATWPEWMRKINGFDDAKLTAKQRKQAAALLRKRADELDPKGGAA